MPFQGLHGDILNGFGVLAQELLRRRRNRDIVPLHLYLRNAIDPHWHAFAGINILLLLHIDGEQLQRKDIHLLDHRINKHAAALDNAETDIASSSVLLENAIPAAGNHQYLVWANLGITAGPDTNEHEKDK